MTSITEKICQAEDVVRRHKVCKAVEGKLNDKPQFYCVYCGRKMNPPAQGGM